MTKKEKGQASTDLKDQIMAEDVFDASNDVLHFAFGEIHRRGGFENRAEMGKLGNGR